MEFSFLLLPKAFRRLSTEEFIPTRVTLLDVLDENGRVHFEGRKQVQSSSQNLSLKQSGAQNAQLALKVSSAVTLGMNLTCHDLQNLKFKNEQSVEITGYNSGRAISTTLRKGSVLDKLIEHTDVALHFGSENDLLVIGIVTKVHNAQLEVQISNGMKLAIGLGASQRADAQAKAQSQQFLQS